MIQIDPLAKVGSETFDGFELVHRSFRRAEYQLFIVELAAADRQVLLLIWADKVLPTLQLCLLLLPVRLRG